MTDLVELAKIVEAATGPSRALDHDIAVAIGARASNGAINVAAMYTGSLDAAMTLVPEGCQWGAGSRDATGTAWAWTGVTHDASAISNAATPELALTAACLRALATQGEG